MLPDLSAKQSPNKEELDIEDIKQILKTKSILDPNDFFFLFLPLATKGQFYALLKKRSSTK